MCLMTLPATFARVAGSSAPVRQPIAEQTARPCLHRAVTGVSEKTLNNFKKKPLQSASQVVPVARVRKAEAATHSLTLNYVTVDDYNLVSVAYALEGDGWASEDMDGEAQSVYEVPEGKYTVLALFQSGTFGAPVRAVVAENVNVASDCSVELNAAAATELVSFEPLLPDGTPVKSACWTVTAMSSRLAQSMAMTSTDTFPTRLFTVISVLSIVSREEENRALWTATMSLTLQTELLYCSTQVSATGSWLFMRKSLFRLMPRTAW